MSKSTQAYSTKTEAENLVVDVVALRATLLEEERLCEFEWLLRVAIDAELASDEHKDAVVHWWLVVELSTVGVKSQVRKSAKLLHDRLRSHELFTLVWKHARGGVKVAKLASVRGQRLVVVLDELRANCVEVCHACLVFSLSAAKVK